MSPVFTSWSGGKDSSLACYRAITGGLNVQYLLNMTMSDGRRSWTHGLRSELLNLQAQAVSIPLVQRPTAMTDYEAEFRNALSALKREGVSGGVFGTIDVLQDRQWNEKSCRDTGLACHLPLWGESQENILRDFMALEFKAIVVAVKADLLGEEWLGRKVDAGFLADLSELKKTKNITICGEAGEYHTFVTDGPIFRQRIEIMESAKVSRGGYWFLDIRRAHLK